MNQFFRGAHLPALLGRWGRRLVVPAGLAVLAFATGRAYPAASQSTAVTFFGCLSPQGRLYDVATSPSPPRQCQPNDAAVSWQQAGPPGLSGVEIVATRGATVGLTRSATATCPPGKIALGGGVRVTDESGVVGLPGIVALTGSYPRPYPPTPNPGTGWTVDVRAFDPQNTEQYAVIAYAICATVAG
jgi:hypothetical protein